MILKPSMVIAGEKCPQQASIEEVARWTVKCLRELVPSVVPGCAFLSGGQSDALATAHLNAMNALYKDQLPWQLTFSYGRALQQAALKTWKGQEANVVKAQQELYRRAQFNSAAALGQYQPEMEKRTLSAIAGTT
jgi:fructose-bisphosphate aldolase class I